MEKFYATTPSAPQLCSSPSWQPHSTLNFAGSEGQGDWSYRPISGMNTGTDRKNGEVWEEAPSRIGTQESLFSASMGGEGLASGLGLGFGVMAGKICRPEAEAGS